MATEIDDALSWSCVNLILFIHTLVSRYQWHIPDILVMQQHRPIVQACWVCGMLDICCVLACSVFLLNLHMGGMYRCTSQCACMTYANCYVVISLFCNFCIFMVLIDVPGLMFYHGQAKVASRRTFF